MAPLFPNGTPPALQRDPDPAEPPVTARPFTTLDVLVGDAQLDAFMSEHNDTTIIARDLGSLGPRRWTADRVYCANLVAQHLVSLPRNPPAEATT